MIFGSSSLRKSDYIHPSVTTVFLSSYFGSSSLIKHNYSLFFFPYISVEELLATLLDRTHLL